MGKPMQLGTGVFKLLHRHIRNKDPAIRKTVFEKFC